MIGPEAMWAQAGRDLLVAEAGRVCGARGKRLRVEASFVFSEEAQGVLRERRRLVKAGGPQAWEEQEEFEGPWFGRSLPATIWVAQTRPRGARLD